MLLRSGDTVVSFDTGQSLSVSQSTELDVLIRADILLLVSLNVIELPISSPLKFNCVAPLLKPLELKRIYALVITAPRGILRS